MDACYYKTPLGSGFLPAGMDSITVPLSQDPSQGVDRVVLQEDITGGQYLVSYTVEVLVGGAWTPFSQGVTVGSKRIDIVKAAAAGATALRFTVTEAFAPGHVGVTITALSGTGCATS
jgi:hypothetical protein